MIAYYINIESMAQIILFYCTYKNLLKHTGIVNPDAYLEEMLILKP